MGQILFAIIKTARPRQWLKNLAVFTTILFTGQFFVPSLFRSTLLAFFAFCLLSSSNYIFNDVLDAPRDRKHPFKKFRPIANGKLSVTMALGVSLLFAILGLMLVKHLVPHFLCSPCFSYFSSTAIRFFSNI